MIDLLELLDRQYDHVANARTTTAFFVRLRQLVEFLRKDPRLSGVVSEMVRLALSREKAIRDYDDELLDRLRSKWLRDEGILRAAVRSGDPELRQWGDSFDPFSELPNKDHITYLPRVTLLASDPTRSGKALSKLAAFASRAQESARDSDAVFEAARAINFLVAEHEHAYREHWLAIRQLGGAALVRLMYVADRLNRQPTWQSWAEGTEDLLELIDLDGVKRFLFGDGISSREEQGDAEALERRAREDVELSRHELSVRVASGRSHASVVRRFGGRVQTFEADALRQRAKMNSRRAEADLTRRLAEYLFDAGMNPIIDPRIAGLSPDLLDPHAEAPVYVEVKQYAKSPAAVIRKAAGQVWDTWGRLLKTYNIDEAFLVIFRVDGPLAVIPETPLESIGRRLHVSLVDLVPSVRAGSRQKWKPVHLTREDLSPSSSTPRIA